MAIYVHIRRLCVCVCLCIFCLCGWHFKSTTSIFHSNASHTKMQLTCLRHLWPLLKLLFGYMRCFGKSFLSRIDECSKGNLSRKLETKQMHNCSFIYIKRNLWNETYGNQILIVFYKQKYGTDMFLTDCSLCVAFLRDGSRLWTHLAVALDGDDDDDGKQLTTVKSGSMCTTCWDMCIFPEKEL